jgi:hypothetical protein
MLGAAARGGRISNMDAEARIVCEPVVQMGVSYESDGLR